MASNKSKTIVAVAAAILLTAAIVFTALRLVHASHLAASPDIAGVWLGTVSAQGAKQNVALKITGTKGNYHATIDQVDMGMRDIPVTELVYDYPALHCEMAGGTYQAKVNAGATEISGVFSQGKAKIKVTLKRTTDPEAIPAALTESDYAPRKDSDLQGLWKGTLDAGRVQLRLNFKFAEQADGTYRAEMDSVDQGATGVRASSAEYDRPTVKLKFDSVGGSLEGQVNGGKITAVWKQAGKPFPLTLERADARAESAQDADKTFAHASNAELQGHWKGTLTVPIPKQATAKLHLVLDIAKLPDGTFSGALTSVDQGTAAIPATALEYTAPQLRMEWKAMNGAFTGELKSGKLTGKWSQGGGGASFPLVFERN